MVQRESIYDGHGASIGEANLLVASCCFIHLIRVLFFWDSVGVQSVAIGVLCVRVHAWDFGRQQARWRWRRVLTRYGTSFSEKEDI